MCAFSCVTQANRIPVVGCHAKPKQQMMEIKVTAWIRGAEGERREPHVSENGSVTKFQSLANLSKKQLFKRTFSSQWAFFFPSSSHYFITSLFPDNTEGTCLILLQQKLPLVLGLSHPAVPVVSERIRQPRPPATKYVLKQPMNIWSLWSNASWENEAFSGWDKKCSTKYL